jgi:hypothetical protein
MRGEERKQGPPNKERGDGVGDGSLQSHSGVNLHPKTAKNRGNVLKGGKADGVALTDMHSFLFGIRLNPDSVLEPTFFGLLFIAAKKHIVF